jgi:hypothetical protein
MTPARRVQCRFCEIPFVPLSPRHDLCESCYLWACVYRRIRALHRALRLEEAGR